MKGYAKITVTDEHRNKLKKFIDTRNTWLDEFDYKEYKVNDKWFFGLLSTEYYDMTKVKPPSGIFMFDDKPYKNRWLMDLERLYTLVYAKDDVYLDQDYVELFNNYARD